MGQSLLEFENNNIDVMLWRRSHDVAPHFSERIREGLPFPALP